MKKYILSINKTLGLLCIGSLISVFIIDFWLIDIPAPLPIFEKLGKIYYAVCMSFLTCFIFHFVVVHIPTIKNRQLINGYISTQIQNIINISFGFVTLLAKHKQYDIKDKYPTEEDIIYLFRNTISTEKNPNMVDVKTFRHLMWYETLYDMLVKNQESITKIESKDMYIDAELSLLITNIKEASLIMVAECYPVAKKISEGDNMVVFSTFFYDYLKHIQSLKTYLHKKMS